MVDRLAVLCYLKEMSVLGYAISQFKVTEPGFLAACCLYCYSGFDGIMNIICCVPCLRVTDSKFCFSAGTVSRL